MQQAGRVKKLPIGIQTFSEIISENYYYVDKTEILHRLNANGKYYFLSRPRRFGKSLFLDTIREAFLGNRELFKGLYLENSWNWEKKYPVIRIDFGSGVLKSSVELDQKIREMMKEIETSESVTLTQESVSGRFRELIQSLQKKHSERVVILVDEYDKPILDNITDRTLAREMRDGLRNFYSVIKGADAHIRFVFITGVSKFSKVNLFSGLNNLSDITLDERYSAVCGYTEAELSVFEAHLQDANRAELKNWYNGYNFLGEKVYNPFDILLFLDRKQIQNYWFETGNPSFLIDLIKENTYNMLDIENIRITEEEMGAFDVDNIRLETLLFQTGYLTIREKYRTGTSIRYRLQFPNQEVKQSLTAVTLNALSSTRKSVDVSERLYKALESSDISGLRDIFHSFFASIPHDWYRSSAVAGYEAFYASIFYCYFTALGIDTRPEDVTNHGQADMTVLFQDRIFVFEFKVIELTESGSALAQIKKKKYYEKYLDSAAEAVPAEIFLIGVEFSKEERNITNFEWENAVYGSE